MRQVICTKLSLHYKLLTDIIQLAPLQFLNKDKCLDL